MAYGIRAFIGRPECFSAVEGAPINAVALPQGMTLVPLVPALYSWLRQPDNGASSNYPGFELLSESVFQLGLRLSQRGAVAYVEADFFGNSGGQDAIVWQHGAVVMKPMHSFNGLAASPRSRPRQECPGAGPCYPINEALRRLGVEKDSQSDEFDALGLGRHRKTEHWIG
jgi:hypothetical protein